MSYLVHSVVHHPSTRTVRAQAPIHHRHKQFILKAQRRLIPNRPIAVSHEELHENLDELRAKNAQGILEVRTPDGTLIDLATLELKTKNADPPLPVVPDDSARFDPKHGEVNNRAPTLPTDPNPPAVAEGIAAGLILDPPPSDRPLPAEDGIGEPLFLDEPKEAAPAPILSAQEPAEQEDAPIPPAEEAALAGAFGGTSEEEEPEVEQVETVSKPKKNKRK